MNQGRRDTERNQIQWNRQPAFWASISPCWLIRLLNRVEADWFLIGPFVYMETMVTDAIIAVHDGSSHPEWIHWGAQREQLVTVIARSWAHLKDCADPGVLTLKVSGFRITAGFGLHHRMHFHIPMAAGR